MRVSFQGETGAFSEEAVLAFFENEDVELVPLPTFDEVFASLDEGDVDRAVVPIENSLHGSVHANYDHLREHAVHIVGELKLRIVHQLMGLPGTRLEEIAKVYSHPQAIGQCQEFLRERLEEAEAIAAYLRMQGEQLREFQEHDRASLRSFYRSVVAAEGRSADVTNQIKSLLPQLHPGLVPRTADSGLPRFICALLKKYPTAAQLAQADPQELAQIPYLTLSKATSLIEQARRTTGASDDPHAGMHLQWLLDQRASQQAIVEKGWLYLEGQLQEDPDWRRLQTICGIGSRTATALMFEIGDFRQFASAKAVVGYCGLDAVYEQSGDGLIQRGISRRGPAALRQLLYNAARSAMIHNPAQRAFGQRLQQRGKTYKEAVVAVMAKLLRVAYACIVKGEDYDPAFAAVKKERQSSTDKAPRRQPGRHRATIISNDLQAPVSAKERRRRKQRAAEGREVRGQSLKAVASAATDSVNDEPGGAR